MAKTKSVKMLTSMAGEAFDYKYGQIVVLPKTVADAWVEEGLAEANDEINKKTLLDLTAAYESALESLAEREAKILLLSEENQQLTEKIRTFEEAPEKEEAQTQQSSSTNQEQLLA